MRGTFEDEGLDLALDKSLQGSLALSLFLFQSLKALIELSLGRLNPSLHRSPALLFLIFLVCKFVFDGLDHVQHLSVPAFFEFGALEDFLFSLVELMQNGPLLLRFAHLG
jgi:hypothetical protein